jgi:phosphoribosyl 1,2-cyclic phosphodiesterase
VRLTILGSGSAGNCAYIETDRARILIDAGFSLRQIRRRLALIGRVPENLTGVLITHEHSDHVQGLALLGSKLGIPVYCNRPTKDALDYEFRVPLDFRLFTTGDSFDVEDVGVETFSVPHDAQDPVGYLLHVPGARLGFLTDLGVATKLVVQRIRPATVLVLESNHDVKMLQECPHRPWSLKQRILSRHGHLSNEAAADAVEEVMNPDLCHLYLGHLSRECNTPEIAAGVISQRLQRLGAQHVHLTVTSQDTPSTTLSVGVVPQVLSIPTVLTAGMTALPEPAASRLEQSKVAPEI